MTLVLNGKDLVLEGSNTKTQDKPVPGIYIYIGGCFQRLAITQPLPLATQPQGFACTTDEFVAGEGFRRLGWWSFFSPKMALDTVPFNTKK